MGKRRVWVIVNEKNRVISEKGLFIFETKKSADACCYPAEHETVKKAILSWDEEIEEEIKHGKKI